MNKFSQKLVKNKMLLLALVILVVVFLVYRKRETFSDRCQLNEKLVERNKGLKKTNPETHPQYCTGCNKFGNCIKCNNTEIEKGCNICADGFGINK